MPHQDPVEIKITLSGSVAATVSDLNLGPGSPLQIWFLEDLTPGLPEPLPLLAAGVILRLRAKGDEDDSTVKLRPARRSQLAQRWASDDKKNPWQHRIEGDWSASKHVLAVSSVLTLPPGSASAAVSPGGSLAGAFDSHQLEFLADCADLKLNPSGLTALGPINAIKWKKLTLGGVPDVYAERWTLDELDFLELSIRADPGDGVDPATAQAAFEAAVRACGLDFGDHQASKTEQVLTHLAARAKSG